MGKHVRRLNALMGLALCALALAAGSAAAQETAGILKKGDRVAIVGDSITEQQIYSRFIETYLLACLPELDLRTIQLGWSGEAAPGLLARLDNDLLPWKPNVVTLCYGMNDACYQPYDDEIGKRFEANMQKVLAKLKAAGAKVVIGSPGIVDPYYFPPKYIKDLGKTVDAKTYNESLARLHDIAYALAEREGFLFADVYEPMMQITRQLKEKYGEKAIIAGTDGIHPWDDGHLVMAYAFLRGIGVDGEIGTITLDMKGAATSASEGHRVCAATPGQVELESTRYPFCFAKPNRDDEKSSWSARTALPCLPFNQELNRLTLRVKNLHSERATVHWGSQAKSFTRKQLEEGINLAAEFLDNPFSEPFARVDQAVRKKEAYENFMIKKVVTQFRQLPGGLGPDAEKALKEARAALDAEDGRLAEAARAAVRPVRHTITITEP